MTTVCTGGLSVIRARFGSLPNLKGYNTCGNCNNRVTSEHGHRGQNLSQNRDWGNIPVAHRGDGDNGPVDTLGDGSKSVHLSFNKIKHGAQDQYQGKHCTEEDDDLSKALLKCPDQEGGFFQISSQFKYPEYSEQPECTDGKQEGGVIKYQTHVSGKDGQQVHNPKKTGHVFPRTGGAIYSEQILQGKDNGEEPFGSDKEMFVGLLKGGNTLQHHDSDAENDHPEQDHIKCFSSPCIGAKNCDKYKFLQIHFLQSYKKKDRPVEAAFLSSFLVPDPIPG